jgi:hypothetical protein
VSGPNIPDDVRRFILGAIPSVPYLEAILLMRGSAAAHWDAASLAAGLYLSEKAADALLEQLHAAGIIEPTSGDKADFRYAPASQLRLLIDRLADAYATNLIGVSTLIHSGTGKKAQHFADAFRFRKET